MDFHTRNTTCLSTMCGSALRLASTPLQPASQSFNLVHRIFPRAASSHGLDISQRGTTGVFLLALRDPPAVAAEGAHDRPQRLDAARVAEPQQRARSSDLHRERLEQALRDVHDLAVDGFSRRCGRRLVSSDESTIVEPNGDSSPTSGTGCVAPRTPHEFR